MIENYSIGKGKHFSIAKAALIFYYESGNFKDGDTFDYGNFGYMHEIVDIAGCTHRGAFTSTQVSSRLIGSPLWSSECVRGFYKGMAGNGRASLLKPSEKGKVYYETHLKGREQGIKLDSINPIE